MKGFGMDGSHNRRELFHLLSSGVAGALTARASAAAVPAAAAKPMAGIFPIAQTPFTDSGELDTDALVEELRFIHRGGVHGFVWPQLASEWDTLTEDERLAGAEALGAAARNLRPTLVLGVQGPGAGAAVKYAKHAAKAGANAIISLPPPGESEPGALLAYYKEVGAATPLPLFVQAIGQMSVEAIVEMYRAIPTLRYVKDEAGQPLRRIRSFREKTSDELRVFTGGHGRTLIDEMIRGFSGSMPAASFADVYAAAWDQWHAGRKKESVTTFANAALLIHEVSAYEDGMKYILELRGVFRGHAMRPRKSGSATASQRFLLDETGKQVFRELLQLMKPYLRV
jgi:4-hydroxy-tetrahydrodipicolinate synthase